MKDDDILLEVARSFREGIVRDGCSVGYCFMVCAPLEGYLHFVGIDAKLVRGVVCGDDWEVEHCWLQLIDGRVLDPTADQFDNFELPEVYLGLPHSDVHQETV